MFFDDFLSIRRCWFQIRWVSDANPWAFLIKREKIKMAAKSWKRSFFGHLTGWLVLSCQFEGAESKPDECLAQNLEHFSQNANIQNGRQIMKTLILWQSGNFMFSCQFEGAESKSDECQTQNLQHLLLDNPPFHTLVRIQQSSWNSRCQSQRLKQTWERFSHSLI